MRPGSYNVRCRGDAEHHMRANAASQLGFPDADDSAYIFQGIFGEVFVRSKRASLLDVEYGAMHVSVLGLTVHHIREQLSSEHEVTLVTLQQIQSFTLSMVSVCGRTDTFDVRIGSNNGWYRYGRAVLQLQNDYTAKFYSLLVPCG